MSLKGKVCVVLGASGTVGQGACVSFLQEGATLVAVSRDQGKADALKKKLIEVTKVRCSNLLVPCDSSLCGSLCPLPPPRLFYFSTFLLLLFLWCGSR